MTYQRRGEIFDGTHTPCSPRGIDHIFHQAIPLNPEAECRTSGQPDNPHGRCDVREGEREHMRYAERRRHSQEILQLVPCTFLHLQLELKQRLTASIKKSKLTRSLLAVFGSMTFRTSRTSWVSECPTCPCLITNDLGTPSAVPGAEATPPLR